MARAKFSGNNGIIINITDLRSTETGTDPEVLMAIGTEPEAFSGTHPEEARELG